MNKIKTLSFLFCVFFLSACYNNSVEELAGEGTCNTQDISYNEDIRRIINISCALSGCHNAGAATTFSLSAYAELKEQANSGLLLKAINHAPGAVPMPKSASKLTNCEINKIRAWVNAGTPDN